MKESIKKRANEYAEEMVAEYKEPRAINVGLAKFKEQYVRIATEQKSIDIEKAYNLFKTFLIKNGQSEEVIEEKLWDFCRKMEE